MRLAGVRESVVGSGEGGQISRGVDWGESCEVGGCVGFGFVVVVIDFAHESLELRGRESMGVDDCGLCLFEGKGSDSALTRDVVERLLSALLEMCVISWSSSSGAALRFAAEVGATGVTGIVVPARLRIYS